jgi:hypothetical protein
MRATFQNTSEILIGKTSMSREQMRTPSVVDNGIHYSTNFDTNNTPRDNIQLLIQSMNESSPSLEHKSTL